MFRFYRIEFIELTMLFMPIILSAADTAVGRFAIDDLPEQQMMD